MVLQNVIENDRGEFRIVAYKAATEGEVTLKVSFSGGGAEKVIASVTNSGFLYVRRDPDGVRVESIWEAGTGFVTVIVQLDAAHPDVTECGAEIEPDFIAGRQREYMLQYEGKDFRASGSWEPRSAYIYFWSNGAFRLASVIPYSGRFDELKRLDVLTTIAPARSVKHVCTER